MLVFNASPSLFFSIVELKSPTTKSDGQFIFLFWPTNGKTWRKSWLK
jgi:hypothetical protein